MRSKVGRSLKKADLKSRFSKSQGGSKKRNTEDAQDRWAEHQCQTGENNSWDSTRRNIIS